MRIAAGTGTEPWEIVAYEAQMLFDLARLLASREFEAENKTVRNALVESACLHARILVDILLSKDSHWGDDIRLDLLLPGFQHSSVDELRKAYSLGNIEGSPCWILNKMIAHPTLKRGHSYDYTNVFNQLLPLIQRVWQEIENYRGMIQSKGPHRTSGVGPRLCAKTSS